MKSLLFIVLLAITGVVHVADPLANDFTGTYERVGNPATAFSLQVTQKGKTASISFSAANVDGSGAAPDGDGQGTINPKSELTFRWSDSFENGGTGVLRRDGKVFRLLLNATKVEEPRCLRHYGDFTLRRTSAKPPATNR